MKKLIVGNWKMNPASLRAAVELSRKIQAFARRRKNVSVVICPPAPFLGSISGISGAQDVSVEKEGAHTGEISAEMAKSAGAAYAIIGHSERRLRGDTNDIVNLKLKRALSAGLTPILCVGERERDQNEHYLSVISSEVRHALLGVPKNKVSKIIFAYEPVWAIGKGSSPLNADEAFHMGIFIRKVISDIVGDSAAKRARILYGGSVEPKNAHEFFSVGKVDGLLVGRESLSVANFSEIIAHAAKN
ncbi:MAG: triose-phosphate isomerase [Patescibacteria group bacterium]